MKIGALMVTEDRGPIWGIGLASYLTQTHPDARLLVYADPLGDYLDTLARLTDAPPASNFGALLVAVAGTMPKPVRVEARLANERGCETVSKLLDKGAEKLFAAGCDLVALFDDDDWSPSNRLAYAAAAVADIARGAGSLDKHPILCSYASGWMINLRTFEGLLCRPPYLWGSALTFNKQAWLQADGLAGPWPGFDALFTKRLRQRGGLVEIVDPGDGPINFCHNKNVASFAVGPELEDCSAAVHARLPPAVLREVLAGQQLMIDRRVFPQGTNTGTPKG